MSAHRTVSALIITRADIKRVMRPPDYLAAVEQALSAAIYDRCIGERSVRPVALSAL